MTSSYVAALEAGRGGGPSALPVGGRRRGVGARVVLVAEQRLVGDAVRVALASTGVETELLPWPTSHRPAAAQRRRVAALRCRAGVLVAELDSPQRRDDALTLLRAVVLPWLVLVGSEDEAGWGALVEAGATGILPLSVGLDDLVDVLDVVLAGGDPLGDDRRQVLVDSWSRESDLTRRALLLVGRLSPREREILGLLHDGHVVRDIAAMAGATELTVRSQVKAVLRKLEVRSQLAAVAVLRRTLGRRA